MKITLCSSLLSLSLGLLLACAKPPVFHGSDKAKPSQENPQSDDLEDETSDDPIKDDSVIVEGKGEGSTTQQKPPVDPVATAKDISAAALKSLEALLLKNPSALTDINKESFAKAALTSEDAAKVRTRLWDEWKKRELAARQSEIKDFVVKAAGQTMRYKTKIFGNKPAKGRSLYVSLHGGGQTAASVNDEQWNNQIDLYQPSEGLYLAPRAPTDTWDLWQMAHIDALLDRLISSYILTGEVDPDRVYFMGYSAGGDGLYQLGPRMADRLAAASMSAGHPGDASPIGLRNIGFAIHCGGDDSAYDRNKLAGEWGRTLDNLEKGESGSYKHQVNVVAGKGHWMDLVDAESVPWMGGFTRNPFPKKIAWHQDDVNHNRFYWVSVDTPKTGTELTAEIKDQTITIKDDMPGVLRIRLNEDMIDFAKDIKVLRNGKETTLKALRTVEALLKTTIERGDPRSIFSAELTIPQ